MPSRLHPSPLRRTVSGVPPDTDVPLKSPRRRRGGATVDDVARHAGVSPMTVSRVVNGMANVRAETRERVAAAIAALDYAPNLAARSLASAGDLRLGLLYANPSAAYLSAFLLGGLEHATAINAQLLVVPCADAEDIAQAASRLARAGVDGVILPAPLCDNIDVQALIADAALPAVAVASGAPLAAMAASGSTIRPPRAQWPRIWSHRDIAALASSPAILTRPQAHDDLPVIARPWRRPISRWTTHWSCRACLLTAPARLRPSDC